MRFFTRALTGLFLAALTLGLLAYAGLILQGALRESAAREPGARPASEQVIAANVVTLSPETIAPVIDTFGEIRARRSLDLRAAVPGRIVALGEDVEDGGRVAEGQLLVAIDPAEAARALRSAEADLADARAEVKDSGRAAEIATDDLAAARDQADLRDRALSRQQGLQSRGVATAAAVEEAELAAAAARQQVLSARQAEADSRARIARGRTALSRAEIAVDEARRTLADTRLAAAFAGTISELAVTEGGLVSQNERLATLIDPDRLEIAFRLSTPAYARLLGADGRLPAAEATVALEVAGHAIASPATITREAPAVAEGESGRLLYARIAEPAGFRPGDFARIRIEEPPLEGVARLPASAVASDGTVLALGEGDRLELAAVEVLRSQGDAVIVRAEGLAGREVVAERSPLLGPGIKVRPLRQSRGAVAAEETAALVDLTPEHRAELIAMVEADTDMEAEARERVLAALNRPQVPADIVERLEGQRDG